MIIQNSTLEATPRKGWITRRAKLFEAGEYPDKGVTVEPSHLAALASRFAEPVPVLIEHAESPLQMGQLTKVEAIGNELFGTVELTPEANDLVESSGARSLSIGLAADLSAIHEVSLVRNPRVPTARLFTEGITFFSELDLEGDSLADATAAVFTEGSWRKRYEDLAQQRREEEAERRVRQFVAEGKITPAQAPFAKSLLLAQGESVTFDGRIRTVAQLFSALLEQQPTLALFDERAPDRTDYSSQLLLPEEVAFYRQHFPDVSLEEIAKIRNKRH
jgi:hypothetical protein